MSRSVTVYDLDPEDLGRLTRLSKDSNPRQAARSALKHGLQALCWQKDHPTARPTRVEFDPKCEVEIRLDYTKPFDDAVADFTAEATPGEV